MMGLKGGAVTVAGLCLVLAACDGGASAVPVREQAVIAEPAVVDQGDVAPQRASTTDPRQAAIPRIDGRPMWSANRRFTAEQNAQRHFERNGEAFGAKTVKDYVAKAHAFVSDPPKGVQTLTRANGDRLLYDPAGNVFAVATREGAPRVMFKPDEGAAYWTQVKAQEAARLERRRSGGRSGGDGDS